MDAGASKSQELIHGGIFVGDDVITFEAATLSELRQAFDDSVNDYLEFCKERGELPAKLGGR